MTLQQVVLPADATDAEAHSLSLPKKESSRLCDADFNDFKKTARCIEDDETNGVEVVPSDNNTLNNNVSNSFIENKTKYVTPKDFELLTVIGNGAFGRCVCYTIVSTSCKDRFFLKAFSFVFFFFVFYRVLQVRNKQSKKILAMKIISKRLLRRKNSYVKQIQLERDILKRIRHPFIVSMHCSFQTKEKLFIVMDFLAGGELFLRIGKEGIFLEDQAAFYLAEIILALEHLHNNDILHRDLKPENVLLSSDGHVCLTDFGLSKDFSLEQRYWSESTAEDPTATDNDNPNDSETRAKTICGTTEYMAPEMIAKKGYGKAADFWSLGCLFYEMLSGRTPFHSKLGEKDILRKILSERIKMPHGTTSNACKVLKGLLNRNPQDRLGAAKSTMFQIGGVAGLKQMEFFSSIVWLKLERKEVDPPTRFVVDSETDLRHFHDEFKKMNIPPSVVHMTRDEFSPRRCASHHFPGFSFVQEDFELPDREDDEFEKYWNNTEADGESASEVSAGAISDFDTTPGIKKRPPRKRNKNKATDPSSNVEPESSSTKIVSPQDQQSPVTQENTVAKTVLEGFARTAAPDSVRIEPLGSIVPDSHTSTSHEINNDRKNCSLHEVTELVSSKQLSVSKTSPLSEDPSPVYVPPRLRQKQASQAGSYTSTYKAAPTYINSRKTEQHSRVDVLTTKFSAVSLQQSQVNPSNNGYNKPFPGSWAVVKPSPGSAAQQIKKYPSSANISIDSKSGDNVTYEAANDKLLQCKPYTSVQKKEAPIEEVVSIESFHWPTLGEGTKPEGLRAASKGASNNTPWGSNVSGAAVVVKGSAWNKAR